MSDAKVLSAAFALLVSKIACSTKGKFDGALKISIDKIGFAANATLIAGECRPVFGGNQRARVAAPAAGPTWRPCGNWSHFDFRKTMRS